MNRMTRIIAAFALVLGITAGANAQSGKVLVAYFSRADENYGVGVIEKGNTEIIAEMIAQKTGADVFKIDPVTPYPAVYNECTRVAQQELRDGARPAFKGTMPDISSYDTIFLGYPIWWGDLPMIVYTFLESADFSGKTIVPFCTHAGSGLASTDGRIARALPGATVKSGLAVSGRTAQNSRSEAESAVTRWLSNNGF